MTELIIILSILIIPTGMGLLIGRHIERQELKYYALGKMLERDILLPDLNIRAAQSQQNTSEFDVLKVTVGDPSKGEVTKSNSGPTSDI